MGTYQVTMKKRAYIRPNLKAGDVFVGEFSDEEVARYKKLGVAEFKKGDFGTPKTPEIPALTLASLSEANVKTVTERLETGVWDADTVAALEAAGAQRQGVTDAIAKLREDKAE